MIHGVGTHDRIERIIVKRQALIHMCKSVITHTLTG